MVHPALPALPALLGSLFLDCLSVVQCHALHRVPAFLNKLCPALPACQCFGNNTKKAKLRTLATKTPAHCKHRP